MKRRKFLGAMATLPLTMQPAYARSIDSNYHVQRTDEEWREILSSAEYQVMQEGGREPEGTSYLVAQSENGLYLCRGCELEIYASNDKIHPGQGWPAFTQPLYERAVHTVIDRPAIHRSTEVHCRRCESHLGDIMPEPASPTGEIHLLNGVALVFLPVLVPA